MIYEVKFPQNLERLFKTNEFNLRVSINNYNTDRDVSLKELIRDSLGEGVVNNPKIVLGHFSLLRSNGDIETFPFQIKGSALLDTYWSSFRKSVAVRINIRLKEGGFKSWLIIA